MLGVDVGEPMTHDQADMKHTNPHYGEAENGHKVYEPIYTDGKEHDIGYPQYILSKGNSLRWTKNWEESLNIMTTLG